MKEYSTIVNLEKLRQARNENEKARIAACRRILKGVSAIADTLSPTRLLEEITNCISPFMEIYSLFKKFKG